MYIIFSNINGALYSKDKQIDAQTKKDIIKAQEAGVDLVLATYSDNLEKVNSLAKDLKAKYTIVDNGSIIFDIEKNEVIYKAESKENINKASAVNFLIEKENVSLDNIMTIGNTDKDDSMLELTENSYALANAGESTKKSAKRHASSVEQNGLGEAIVDFMYRKKIGIN